MKNQILLMDAILDGLFDPEEEDWKERIKQCFSPEETETMDKAEYFIRTLETYAKTFKKLDQRVRRQDSGYDYLHSLYLNEKADRKKDNEALVRTLDIMSLRNQNNKKRGGNRRAGLTQKEAVKVIMDVRGIKISERQIRNWNNGVNRPDDYPGLNDAVVFRTWLATANIREKTKYTIVNMSTDEMSRKLKR